MTQNRLILGVSSFFIAMAVFVYISGINPLNATNAYAASGNVSIGGGGQVSVDVGNDAHGKGEITGIIRSSGGTPLANIPVTIRDNTTIIASGVTDAQGRFTLTTSDAVKNLNNKQLNISVVINGDTYENVFTLKNNDKFFSEVISPFFFAFIY
jgi:hypothetical protein